MYRGDVACPVHCLSTTRQASDAAPAAADDESDHDNFFDDEDNPRKRLRMLKKGKAAAPVAAPHGSLCRAPSCCAMYDLFAICWTRSYLRCIRR